MALLTRDSVLKAQDVATKDVAVPEWGGDIRVRSMTVAERAEFVRRSGSSEERDAIGAWLVATLSVDAGGAQLFKPEDVAALVQRNFRALDRVMATIFELNALDAKKVEEAAKN